MNAPFELTVMMYHYVRDPGDPAEAGSGIAGLPIPAFEAQLDALSKRQTFVTWLDVRQALEGTKPLPPSACLLTFDDGVCDHYQNVFRILRARGLSGLFFVMARQEKSGLTLPHKIHFLLARLSIDGLREELCRLLSTPQRDRFQAAEDKYRLKYGTDALDDRINLLKAALQRDLSEDVDPLLGKLFETHIGSERDIAESYYLNLDQMREMSASGMHLGGHSQNHPWFDWIDARQRELEIRASAELLRQVEPGPWAFAYPYGGLKGDAPAILAAHGFVAAFTTRSQFLHKDPFYIGRLDGEEFAQEGQRYG